MARVDGFYRGGQDGVKSERFGAGKELWFFRPK